MQISIITPVYNAEKYLAQTIQSVIAQTYSHWELLLVIDQKSHDKSQVIAQGFAQKDTRIKVVSNANCLGVAQNRNEGINMATGDFIAFLDADDMWNDNKLEVQVKHMQNHNVYFSFHEFQPIDESGFKIGKIRRVPLKISYQELLKNNVIGCSTVMIKSEFAKNQQFTKDVHHEDFVYWLNVLEKTKTASGIPQCLSSYRIVKGSRSDNKLNSALGRWKIYRETLKLDFLTSSYNFVHYAMSGLLKR